MPQPGTFLSASRTSAVAANVQQPRLAISSLPIKLNTSLCQRGLPARDSGSPRPVPASGWIQLARPGPIRLCGPKRSARNRSAEGSWPQDRFDSSGRAGLARAAPGAGPSGQVCQAVDRAHNVSARLGSRALLGCVMLTGRPVRDQAGGERAGRRRGSGRACRRARVGRARPAPQGGGLVGGEEWMLT